VYYYKSNKTYFYPDWLLLKEIKVFQRVTKAKSRSAAIIELIKAGFKQFKIDYKKTFKEIP